MTCSEFQHTLQYGVSPLINIQNGQSCNELVGLIYNATIEHMPMNANMQSSSLCDDSVKVNIVDD